MSFRLLEAVKSKLLQCNDTVLRKSFPISTCFSLNNLYFVPQRPFGMQAKRRPVQQGIVNQKRNRNIEESKYGMDLTCQRVLFWRCSSDV